MNAPVELATIELHLTNIAPSPTNPRKHFNEDSLKELAENIKQIGVMQPILVRPKRGSGGTYELVFGERRWRAAKLAGLKTIPAMSRTLTDAEVLEIQVVENLQREDVHPIEEAEGYAALMKLHHFTVDQLSAKTGKSKAYIYARLKLCACSPKVCKAFFEYKIDASIALLLGRIPTPKLQEEALHLILNPDEVEDAYYEYDAGERMSYRDAAELVQDCYMTKLSRVVFDPSSDKLLPEAGSCTKCPKRSGNQPDLLAEIENADVCTDPICFAKKRQAHIDVVTKEAKESGQKIITGEEARKVMRYGPHSMTGFVALDEVCDEDSKNRTYRQILGKDAPAPVLIETDPESRRDDTPTIVEALPEADIKKLLAAKGIKSRNSPSKDYAQEQRNREKNARAESAARTEILMAIRTKWPRAFDATDLGLVCETMWERTWNDARRRVAKIWGWDEKINPITRIRALSADQKGQLMVDLALAPELVFGAYSSGSPTKLNETAKRLGIDVNAIRAKAKVATAEKTKPAKNAPAKKAAKKGSAK